VPYNRQGLFEQSEAQSQRRTVRREGNNPLSGCPKIAFRVTKIVMLDKVFYRDVQQNRKVFQKKKNKKGRL